MFILKKFLSGFNIFSGEKLAKIIFYAILIAIGIGIYHNAFKPKTIYMAPVTQITYTESKEIAKFKLWKILEVRLVPYSK